MSDMKLSLNNDNNLKVKCKKCEEENRTSKVFIHHCYTTCIYSPPYYDEEGNYHSHDPNVITTYYECSNGHDWIDNIKRVCPTCGRNK